MQIVNGYVCQTGCDVAAAKKGHDPKNPHDDPVKAAALAEAKGLVSGKSSSDAGGLSSTSDVAGFSSDAVVFGGMLAMRASTASAGQSPIATPLVDRFA